MKLLWITINVKSIEESISFYSDLLDLQVVRRFKAGQTMELAFLGNGKENETLVEFIEDTSKDSIKQSGDISIGFEVDSLDLMLKKVHDKSIAVTGGPIETPTSRFFFIKDPNGLIVQFVEKKVTGNW